MKTSFLPLLCMPVMVSSPMVGQSATLHPIDEASKNPAFLQFRSKVLGLVMRRDSKGLMKLVHEDTQISFGGSRGPKEFIKWWHPENPESKVWIELDKILNMGGTFSPEGGFEVPYVSSAWPEEYDAFEHSAITGEGISCFEEPNQNTKPFRKLTFEIVRTPVNDSNFQEYKRLLKNGWRKVELLDGKVGFVRSKYIRGACDQRIYFSKTVEGTWFISAFIAGD